VSGQYTRVLSVVLTEYGNIRDAREWEKCRCRWRE